MRNLWGEEYISVAKLREKAQRTVHKLKQKGGDPQPVEPFSGSIARSLGGKEWNCNFEEWIHDEGRLERGRRYVRNGCVCDLKVNCGKIDALVLGKKLYKVRLEMAPLSEKAIKSLREFFAASLEVSMALMQGIYTDEVMLLASAADPGIIPSLKEVRMFCDCPDSAPICKHMAAALYGLGRRIDADPGILFEMRQIDPMKLSPFRLRIPSISISSTLSRQHLTEIFGIDLDMEDPDPPQEEPALPALPAASAKKPEQSARGGQAVQKPKDRQSQKERGSCGEDGKAAAGGVAASLLRTAPKEEPQVLFEFMKPAGAGIRALRELAGLSREEFAARINSTPKTITRWESEEHPGLRYESKEKLRVFQEKLLRRLARKK